MNEVLPERITQTREILGLTKTELAEALGVSPAAVAQWESGAKSPTSENLALLARHVGFPIAAFQRTQPPELAARGPLSFRAAASATSRRANLQAEQLAKLVAEVYLWLGQRVMLPAPNIPDVGVPGATPEAAAERCRRAWNLGDRPILKLGELLESQGIVLASASFGDSRFDAFSCMVKGRPFIFLGVEKQDHARSRFDAAHELGHLVMHQYYTERHLSDSADHKEVEKQANSFASAFLMPAATFGAEVFDTTLSGFLRLKERWGVSVQAMVFRAHSIGIIDERRRTELFRQMSVKGWRKARAEPLDDVVPEVRSTLGKQSVDLLVTSGLLRRWEIPNEIPLSQGVLNSALGLSSEDFETPSLPNLILFPSQSKPDSKDSSGSAWTS